MVMKTITMNEAVVKLVDGLVADLDLMDKDEAVKEFSPRRRFLQVLFGEKEVAEAVNEELKKRGLK